MNGMQIQPEGYSDFQRLLMFLRGRQQPPRGASIGMMPGPPAAPIYQVNAGRLARMHPRLKALEDSLASTNRQLDIAEQVANKYPARFGGK